MLCCRAEVEWVYANSTSVAIMLKLLEIQLQNFKKYIKIDSKIKNWKSSCKLLWSRAEVEWAVEHVYANFETFKVELKTDRNTIDSYKI